MKREKEKIAALNNYIHETSLSGCEAVKENAFIAGFEIADKTMLDRACEWLKKNIDLYAYESSNTHYSEIKLTECFEEVFRQAMKGGAE